MMVMVVIMVMIWLAVQEMCVSRPLVMRGIFARKRENAKTAKTRKRDAKTRKRENRENRENTKTRTEVQERESWTAMIISGSSGTSMQNNYIALQ